MKKHNIENIIRKILPIIIVCAFIVGSFSVVYADNTDDVPSISSREEMIAYIRDSLCQRKESIEGYYVGEDALKIANENERDYTDVHKFFDKIFDAAKSEEYAVANYQGDYLRSEAIIMSNYFVPDYEYKDGKEITTKLEFGISVRCTTTHDEQEYVEKHISDFCNKNGLYGNAKTPLQKLKIIHDYICKINKYDWDAYYNDSGENSSSVEKYKHSYSAYGVVKNGRTVCQGYAHAMYAFCREAGLPVRIMIGSDHAWNLVSVDGGKTFYNIDVTWDDEDDDEPQSYHGYFLKSDADVQAYNQNHFRNPEFKTSDFLKKYPVPSKSYVVYKKVNGKNVPYCPYCNQRLYGSKCEHLDEIEIEPGKTKLISIKRVLKKKKIKKKGKKKIVKKRTNKVKVRVSQTKNLSGYEIAFDYSKKYLKKEWYSGYKRTKSSKTSFTIKSPYFKDSGNLYAKARAYKKISNREFYGPWSSIKKIK